MESKIFVFSWKNFLLAENRSDHFTEHFAILYKGMYN